METTEILKFYTKSILIEVYNTIFEVHKEGREYTYSHDAKVAYVQYSNDITDKMNKKWGEGKVSNANLSKDRRNLNR